MVLVVTFYNVIIGQKESSLFNNSNGVFFQYTFELQWNLGGGSSKGAIRVEKKNAAVKKACTYTLE